MRMLCGIASMRRLGASGMAVSALGLLAAMGLAAVAAEADTSAVSAAELAASKPGTVFRVWPLEGGFRPGIKGYRVLYRSTGANREPVAVTGAILFPAERSAGKRDVVAWAHPTTGVDSACAPSLLPDLSGTVQGIDRMADLGYVVVATDYIGLGTRDAHPYLIGVPAAHAVLDSVRAAQQLHDSQAGHRFAVWGHSQGGHAALFTGILASSYAPELDLVGVAAAAPATRLADLFEADRDTSSGRSLTAMAVLSWSRVYGIPLPSLVEPGSRVAFQRLASDCIETLSEFFQEDADEKALAKRFLKVDPITDPKLRGIMVDNTPGPLPAAVPVFIAQSDADTLVRPGITRRYIKTLCQSGARVSFYRMTSSSHMTSGRDSAVAATDWMTRLFKGQSVPNDC
jgi:acetyl esterase/lipase